MLRRGNESHTVNNYISGAREKCLNDNSITDLCSGGVGGAGGAGNAQGQGGGGGSGEGPCLNYDITAEHFTMNNQYVGH
jgi:hypothetical protein